MIPKAQINVDEAAAMVKTGNTLIVGGFGMTGYPVHLIHALANTPTTDLTYIGNNVGESGLGGGRLLDNGQITRVIGSYFTSNPDVVTAYLDGKIRCDVLPQGTLSEAIRAGGAGIGAFYTPTSAGTELAEGRDVRAFNGVDMVLIESITADVAFIRAWRGDAAGNLQYRLTENNFNQSAATAATLVVAEVEELVPIGSIDPGQIHTPGCYVDYLVQASTTLAELGTSASISGGAKKVDDSRMAMAKAALAELSKGDIVNIGIGIPTLVADLITPDHGVMLQTENGMLGVGPSPVSGGAMDFPVNASKIPVTALPGASYFDSADSFAMIRGNHIDVAIMGGLQVDEHGNLANWAVPGKPLLGVGGAMDLASGAEKLIITMTHTDRNGGAKIVPECTLPLTARHVVDVLITDLAVFRFVNGQLTLTALMPGVAEEQVSANTTARYSVSLGWRVD